MDRKTRRLEHRMVKDLPLILEKDTLMVFNKSRVRHSRLYAESEATGAKTEFLLLNKAAESDNADGLPEGRLWRAMVQRAGRRRKGSRYLFHGADSRSAEIVAEEGEFRLLEFDKPVNDAWLDANGHVPLPPYIKREDNAEDGDRYQTVYAKEYGSAAAPTAGLHFTDELFGELEKAGIETAFITLHVGLGTFLPVRTENVEDHRMHEESYTIDEETACRIEKAKREGRKILAVGTTSLRTLESAWEEDSSGVFNKVNGRLRRVEGRTSIFIYPGYKFKITDNLFTNFHTPSSSLLMLVSAFAGREFILDTYKEAIRVGYRFFSYGDASLIL